MKCTSEINCNVSQHPECQKWCVCTHRHPIRAGEGSSESKSSHPCPDNHSGGKKKKKIALYQTEIKWISATTEWLGNSMRFNVLWAVILIFIQRHWVSQEQLEKVFNIFCTFYMYFFPLKWYCCMLAGIAQTSRLPRFSVCIYYLWGELAPTLAFRLPDTCYYKILLWPFLSS